MAVLKASTKAAQLTIQQGGGFLVALFALPWLLLTTSTALADAPYIEFSSDSYSPAFTIQALIDGEPNTPKSGDSIYSFNRFSAGWRTKHWSIGVSTRYDGIIRHSPDAALLYHQDKAKVPIDKDQQYDYHLRADILQSTGLSLGLEKQVNPILKVAARGHVYKTSQLTNGAISGNIGLNGAQLNGGLNVNYRYEEDKLFDRPISVQPTGTAYSLDIDITADLEPWLLQLEITDLIHRAYWEDAPTTIAHASPNTQAVDANGLLQVSPVIRGREFNQDFMQRLPMRSSASVSRSIAKEHSITAKVKSIDNRYYPKLSYGHQFDAEQNLEIGYETKARSIHISWQLSQFRVGLSLDNSFNKAHRALLNINYNID